MKKLLFILIALFLVACASSESSSQTTSSGYDTGCRGGVDGMSIAPYRDDARDAIVAYTCRESNRLIHVVSVPVEHQQ